MGRIGFRYLLLTITMAGVGVWGAAVVLPHDFSPGDIISASQVNANFQALADAVSALEEGITPSGAVVGRSADDAAADLVAAGSGLGDAADDGVISSDPDLPASDLALRSNDNITLELNANDDADPASLTVRNGAGESVLAVDEAGDLAVAGTVTGAGGVGLPFAYGSVSATGTLLEGTANIAGVELDGKVFKITFDGVGYSQSQFVTMVTPAGTFGSTVAPTVRTAASGGTLSVLFYSSGSLATGPFHFLVYRF